LVVFLAAEGFLTAEVFLAAVFFLVAALGFFAIVFLTGDFFCEGEGAQGGRVISGQGGDAQKLASLFAWATAAELVRCGTHEAGGGGRVASGRSLHAAAPCTRRARAAVGGSSPWPRVRA